ncbi:MAG: hypothetical protein BroJett011_42960 [Chloroflexota bacterium]|nr:MAG: hypothetical protein BroJett011_42960 [Chloroflexota bacterium]
MRIHDDVRYTGTTHTFLIGQIVCVVSVHKNYFLDPDNSTIITDDETLEKLGGICSTDLIEIVPYIAPRTLSFITSDACLTDLQEIADGENSHKKRRPQGLDPATQRLVEMTFAPFEEVVAWVNRIGLEVIQNQEGEAITVRNPSLDFTAGVISARSDPVTRAVSLGFATAGPFWPQTYPGLLEAVDKEACGTAEKRCTPEEKNVHWQRKKVHSGNLGRRNKCTPVSPGCHRPEPGCANWKCHRT